MSARNITRACRAKTANGKGCKMAAIRGGRYCFTHSPDHARNRAEARRKGGKNSHIPHFARAVLPAEVLSLEAASAILSYTLAEVAGMDNSLLRARVLLAIHEAALRSIEVGELAARIGALEEGVKA